MGSRIKSYHWSISDKPAGSSASPIPSDEKRIQVEVDRPGTFTLELQVEDAVGCMSAPVLVTIRSSIQEQLYIEMTEDIHEGSEMDLRLHFLNAAKGCWTDLKWDAFFRNPQPDWGAQGVPADDPSWAWTGQPLTRVEALSFDQPEAGTRYVIGVQAGNGRWAEWDNGTATIRVFLSGELIFEAESETIENNDWWLVGSLQFPGPEIVPLGGIYPQATSNGYPACEW